MLATTLRSDKAFDKVLIDLSPMGCRTGFYMSVFGKWTVEKITPIVKKTMDTTLKFSGNIPGATKKECGNYRDHNLVLSKKVLCDFYKGMQW
jgi:S-ribosylhomocysteine lyase